jgi:hypothetical protein
MLQKLLEFFQPTSNNFQNLDFFCCPVKNISGVLELLPEFGSEIYNNLLQISFKFLSYGPFYGQLCITQNRKPIAELGLNFIIIYSIILRIIFKFW